MAESSERRAAAIAVAPLQRPPKDPEQAWVANTFLEDVINELARFPDLEVLAARTSLSLSGEQLQPRYLAQTFGVTHLLDSTVRTGPGAMKVSANLVETSSGRQVWNQSYDVPTRDVLTVMESIAAHVANHASSKINSTRLVKAKARPISSLEAYDCWLRGRDCLRRGTGEGDLEARTLFERALTIDPTYARAWAGLSLTHFNEWSCMRWGEWESNERLAYEYACKADDFDDSDHMVQAVLGRIQLYRRNFGQARRHFERSLALCPNDADGLLQIGLWFGYLGEAERAREMVEKARRLNPLHDPWYYLYSALPYFFTRQTEPFLDLAEKGPPNLIVDQSAFMACVYAHTGQIAKAGEHLDMFLEIFREKITFGRAPEPDEPVAYLIHTNPFRLEADREYLLEGLRKAGLKGTAREGVVYLPEPQGESAQFCRRGQVWEATFGGQSVLIPDMKGCRDIAVLIASPGERIHAMELAGRVAEGDGGPVMDSRSRAQCQARIRDLQDQMAEADRDNDLARSERIGAELDAIIDQLSAALGLGGRGRKLGDPVEKARTAVTWRIRNAIKKLAEQHPELGRHFKGSIRTGAFCVYDPERPVRWSL